LKELIIKIQKAKSKSPTTPNSEFESERARSGSLALVIVDGNFWSWDFYPGSITVPGIWSVGPPDPPGFLALSLNAAMLMNSGLHYGIEQ